MPALIEAPQVLHTQRLLLRPPQSNDAPIIADLAHNPKIAYMTATIPYPYPRSAAEEWIQRVNQLRPQGTLLVYLICKRDDQKPMGAISLREFTNGDLNLAYWLGEPYWGHGFCTEAGRLVLDMAFNQLKVPKVVAKHLAINDPSKRVILRLGFQKVGTEISEIRSEDMTDPENNEHSKETLAICYEIHRDQS